VFLGCITGRTEVEDCAETTAETGVKLWPRTERRADVEFTEGEGAGGRELGCGRVDDVGEEATADVLGTGAIGVRAAVGADRGVGVGPTGDTVAE
jgi:hypothetical protein